jgi:ABC-2 type transport system permease protein
MNGAIFIETLKRTWRQMLYWGIGIGILGYYVVAVIPNVETLTQYTDLLNSMPPVMLQAFGMKDAAVMTTPEGFIAFGFLTYALLLLLVYAVLAGLNITANEEDDGILDMILSLPITRWRIVTEKFAAYSLVMMGIVLLSFVGLLLGMQATSLVLDVNVLFVSTINMLPGLLLVMAVTTFISLIVRRKATAIAIVLMFIITSYFINFIGNAASETIAATLRAVSFFAYADAQEVIANGFSGVNFLVLLAVSAAMFAGSVWAFERRDVGV